MILFVFEGGKGEPTIFDSIKKLFLSGEELRVVKCGFSHMQWLKGIGLSIFPR